MSPWAHGSNEIDTLLGAGTLQRVTGADVGTTALMGRAGSSSIRPKTYFTQIR